MRWAGHVLSMGVMRNSYSYVILPNLCFLFSQANYC